MPGRVFEDDPNIPADERLLRRIPRPWVDWDEHGNAVISSAAFKDEELSINLESIMGARRPAARGCDPQLSWLWFGCDYRRHARSLNQAVAPDPLPEEPAHGVVYGQKKRGGIGGKLRDGALWVVRPVQLEAS